MPATNLLQKLHVFNIHSAFEKAERLTPIRSRKKIYVACLAVQSYMLQGDSPHTEM